MTITFHIFKAGRQVATSSGCQPPLTVHQAKKELQDEHSGWIGVLHAEASSEKLSPEHTLAEGAIYELRPQSGGVNGQAPSHACRGWHGRAAWVPVLYVSGWALLGTLSRPELTPCLVDAPKPQATGLICGCSAVAQQGLPTQQQAIGTECLCFSSGTLAGASEAATLAVQQAAFLVGRRLTFARHRAWRPRHHVSAPEAVQ